jgi:hypothetical protein
VREDIIKHADLLLIQAVGVIQEKIGDASEHIDAFVRRTIAQDFVEFVKQRGVGKGH